MKKISRKMQNMLLKWKIEDPIDKVKITINAPLPFYEELVLIENWWKYQVIWKHWWYVVNQFEDVEEAKKWMNSKECIQLITWIQLSRFRFTE